jgi:hypothetical protein
MLPCWRLLRKVIRWPRLYLAAGCFNLLLLLLLRVLLVLLLLLRVLQGLRLLGFWQVPKQ